jgi:hypothetical protein
VLDPRITRLIQFLNELRRVIPVLRRLLFEAFLFVVELVGIVWFLKSLL